MPAVILPALLAGAAAGISVSAAGAFSFAFSWSAFASSLILSGVSQALAPSPDANSGSGAIGNQGRLVTIRQPIGHHQVIVGRCRVGGDITYIEQVGSDLHIVITWAGHVCQSIDEIWFDDELQTLDGSGDVSGGAYGVTHINETLTSATDTITLTYTPVGAVTVQGPNNQPDITPEYEYYIDVSPAAPAAYNQYSISGTTLTMYSEGLTIAASYDASVADAPPAGGNPSYARIQHSLGGEAGQPFADLVTASDGKWTDAHRQTGCTKSYIRLTANPEKYPNGVPNITAVIRGAKIYDPRTPGTAYSNNAALWVSHYLSDAAGYGVGADYATEIDGDDLTAAANVCEERVSLATASVTFTADASTDQCTLAAGGRMLDTGDGVRVSTTGALPAGLSAGTTYYAIWAGYGIVKLATSVANAVAGTAINITDAGTGTHTLTFWDEARYMVNGAFRSNEQPKDVITRLLAAMAGRAVAAGEKWHIHAGAYEAPTVTLDEDDLAGPTSLQTILSRREACNGVKGLFTDPASSWQPTDFPPYPQPGSAYDTWVALDNGERVWRDVDYSAFVTSGTQAQRLAKIELLRTRYAQLETAPCKLTAYQAMTGRTVGRTDTQLGWTDEPFEVRESTFTVSEDGRLGVELALQKIDSAIYDWSTAEEQAVAVAGDAALPDARPTTTPAAIPDVVVAQTSISGTSEVLGDQTVGGQVYATNVNAVRKYAAAHG